MTTEEINNLKKVSDIDLLKVTHTLVKQERKIGIQILHHLKEIFIRRLYAERGYSSLFSFLCKELLYPEATSFRLLNAMKVFIEFPEIEEKLLTGELSISTVAQVESFCQAKLKAAKVATQLQDDPKKVESPEERHEEKKKILEAVEGHSRRECEKILFQFDTQGVLAQKSNLPEERVVSSNTVEIRFIADEALMAKIQRFKEVASHSFFNPDYSAILDCLLDVYLDKKDPLRKIQKNELKAQLQTEKESSTSTREVPTATEPTKNTQRREYISESINQELWKKSGGRCMFVDPLSGRRCEETRGLEKDHFVVPWAVGGSNTIGNLEMRCACHNLLGAVQFYGNKMDRFLKK